MSKFFYAITIISFMSLIIFPQYLFANNNTSEIYIVKLYLVARSTLSITPK